MDHLPYSPSLAPSDFRLLEPSKKYLADKQFATDVNVKQAVTFLKLLKICKEMMLRRNSKQMKKSKEINGYIVKWRTLKKINRRRMRKRRIKKNKIIYPLSSKTKSMIFTAEMRRVFCQVGTIFACRPSYS